MIFGNLILLPPPPAGCEGFPWNREVPPPTYQHDKEKYPKISIITPSFNQGQYIEQTIRSVLLQNYPNLEFIIIDGGSTDNTLEILQKYDKFITYWVSEKDKGQSDAINKGIARATGQLFNWLNSDDYYAPNALKTIGELYIKSPSHLISAQAYYVDNQGNVVKENPHTPIYGSQLETLARLSINQQSTFLELDKVKALGGVQTSLHYVMDWELLFRYLLLNGQENAQLDKSFIVNFRLHEQSKTMEEDSKLQSQFDLEKWTIYRHLLGKNSPELAKKLAELAKDAAKDYQLYLPAGQENPKLQLAVVAAHFYYQTNKFYYLQQYKKADFYSQMVEKQHLPAQLQKDLRYLRLRIFFKKWFSKL